MAEGVRRRPPTPRAIAMWLARAAIAVAGLALPRAPAHAGDPDTAWVTSIVEEDDFWAPSNKDRYYTHGIRLSTTTGDVQEPFWQAPFNLVGRLAPIFPSPPPDGPDGERVARRYNLILLGQNIYTPQDPTLVNPDPRDRPYAGWLYAGVGLMQDTPGSLADGIDRFDDLELKFGIIGPGSLANATQTRFHLLIDATPFRGWHAQLHDEPTLDLYGERKWRFHRENDDGWGWDTIPQASLRVGNVYDYAAAGGMLRIGRNLRIDYGPPHIDLNTGADYVNAGRLLPGTTWGVYTFIGTEARLVARNIFLDGNSFKSSASVAKIPAVGDLETGAAFIWGHYRLAYTYVYRSPEFIHQDGPHHYGSLNLTFHLAF